MPGWLTNIVIVLWFVGFIGALCTLVVDWSKVGPGTLMRYKTEFAINRIERLFGLGRRPDPDYPEHYDYGNKVLLCFSVLLVVCTFILMVFGEGG